MYLLNESSKLESVTRVYEIGEKSRSQFDHPRICYNESKLFPLQSNSFRANIKETKFEIMRVLGYTESV